MLSVGLPVGKPPSLDAALTNFDVSDLRWGGQSGWQQSSRCRDDNGRPADLLPDRVKAPMSNPPVVRWPARTGWPPHEEPRNDGPRNNGTRNDGPGNDGPRKTGLDTTGLETTRPEIRGPISRGLDRTGPNVAAPNKAGCQPARVVFGKKGPGRKTCRSLRGASAEGFGRADANRIVQLN